MKRYTPVISRDLEALALVYYTLQSFREWGILEQSLLEVVIEYSELKKMRRIVRIIKEIYLANAKYRNHMDSEVTGRLLKDLFENIKYGRGRMYLLGIQRNIIFSQDDFVPLVFMAVTEVEGGVKAHGFNAIEGFYPRRIHSFVHWILEKHRDQVAFCDVDYFNGPLTIYTRIKFRGIRLWCDEGVWVLDMARSPESGTCPDARQIFVPRKEVERIAFLLKEGFLLTDILVRKKMVVLERTA
jgi:hypothetical protein